MFFVYYFAVSSVSVVEWNNIQFSNEEAVQDFITLYEKKHTYFERWSIVYQLIFWNALGNPLFWKLEKWYYGFLWHRL